ncbi:MAG TPA: SGNH/GDSL hydrolase family protein [Actinomycetes bacterium]|nr:SGNH/GDSL hydrolase family protein [Actinomycetes bacterium]
MPHTIRLRRSLLSPVLLAALVTALLVGTPTPAGAAPAPSGPRQYYLSLGDSYGFGLQVIRWLQMLDAGTYTPDAFNTGYTDDLAATIRARLRPDLQVVNYSCPATGVGDMLSPDGCFFQQVGLALHDEFTGSQLDAATAFLRAHPGQVSPVTISVGGRDMAGAIFDCNAEPHCVAHSGAFQTIRTNLTRILGELRAAAPTADILLLLPHNGTIVDFPHDNPLWAAFVLELRTIAAANHVRVANAFAAITLSGRTCELTDACLPPDVSDSHPNDAGYAVMAQLFYDAAGYSQQ